MFESGFWMKTFRCSEGCGFLCSARSVWSWPVFGRETLVPGAVRVDRGTAQTLNYYFIGVIVIV